MLTLSKNEIKHIKIWLRRKDDMVFYHRDELCPFPGFCHKHGKTCKALFPKLKILPRILNSSCPCNQFGIAYVVKRVKKMLRLMPTFHNESNVGKYPYFIEHEDGKD